MKLLEDAIIEKGTILPGDVLKVNAFLNEKVDTELVEKMADEWYKLFKDTKVDKVATIESSGIALALLVALKFKCELVVAKKGDSTNNDYFTASVFSNTKDKDFTISVQKGFIREDENILIIDDFLANGSACEALISIIKYAKANVVGIGVAIEKEFQDGGKKLRKHGYRVESLATIQKMEYNNHVIVFKH